MTHLPDWLEKRRAELSRIVPPGKKLAFQTGFDACYEELSKHWSSPNPPEKSWRLEQCPKDNLGTETETN